MKKAYGYIRVSTDDQARSMDTQKILIEDYYSKECKEEYQLVGHYQDEGVSGGVDLGERPSGKALMEIIKSGDMIIVTRLDRAFRSVRDMSNTLESWDKRGIRFCLLDLRLDSQSPIGKMTLQILGAFAEFERRLIGERTKEGMKNAQYLGSIEGVCGVGMVPYGWQKVPGEDGYPRMVPEETEREHLRIMIEYAAQGYTLMEIAAELKRMGIRKTDLRLKISHGKSQWYSFGTIHHMLRDRDGILSTEEKVTKGQYIRAVGLDVLREQRRLGKIKADLSKVLKGTKKVNSIRDESEYGGALPSYDHAQSATDWEEI